MNIGVIGAKPREYNEKFTLSDRVATNSHWDVYRFTLSTSSYLNATLFLTDGLNGVSMWINDHNDKRAFTVKNSGSKSSLSLSNSILAAGDYYLYANSSESEKNYSLTLSAIPSNFNPTDSNNSFGTADDMETLYSRP